MGISSTLLRWREDLSATVFAPDVILRSSLGKAKLSSIILLTKETLIASAD